jgi:uncharacterized protein (TIGR02453 family)
MSATISKSTLQFLKDLAQNNNRPWFNDNKDRFTVAHENMIEFAEALIDEMSHHDNLVPMTGKKSLFRIYRDVRFSKDKSPYKSNFAGGLKRATKWLRGGYYYHVQPGESFAGGGFWSPNPADLKRIRDEIAADDKPLRKIIADPTFKKTFTTLQGDTVKTAPKGFDKEHPAIDLLKHKQFLIGRSFSDAEVTSPNFLKELVQTFQNMRPFFDYMSDVLTTDSNGVPIED